MKINKIFVANGILHLTLEQFITIDMYRYSSIGWVHGGNDSWSWDQYYIHKNLKLKQLPDYHQSAVIEFCIEHELTL